MATPCWTCRALATSCCSLPWDPTCLPSRICPALKLCKAQQSSCCHPRGRRRHPKCRSALFCVRNRHRFGRCFSVVSMISSLSTGQAVPFLQYQQPIKPEMLLKERLHNTQTTFLTGNLPGQPTLSLSSQGISSWTLGAFLLRPRYMAQSRSVPSSRCYVCNRDIVCLANALISFRATCCHAGVGEGS